MKISTRNEKLALAAALGAALLVTGCGNLSRDVAPDGSGAKALAQPAGASAIRQRGTAPDVVDTADAPAPAAAMRAHAALRATLSGDALFAFDTGEVADIKPAGRAALDALARKLDAPERQAQAVHVVGYSDRLGSESYNRKLSELRAASVRDYLVAQGIAGDRITVEGRGNADPLVTCSERSRAALVECLAPNRRVVVEVRRAD